jgi:hypothetical protein
MVGNDKVYYGIGLLYRPVGLHRLAAAGQYDNPICHCQLYRPVRDYEFNYTIRMGLSSLYTTVGCRGGGGGVRYHTSCSGPVVFTRPRENILADGHRHLREALLVPDRSIMSPEKTSSLKSSYQTRDGICGHSVYVLFT